MEPRAVVSCLEVGPFLKKCIRVCEGEGGDIFIPLFNQKKKKVKRKKKTPEPTHKGFLIRAKAKFAKT